MSPLSHACPLRLLRLPGVLGLLSAVACSHPAASATPADAGEDAVPAPGVTIVSLSPTASPAYSMAVDANYVYFLTGYPGYVVNRVPIDGGPTVTVATSPSPDSIAVGASRVFWTDDGDGPTLDGGTVMSAPLDGGSPSVFAGAQIEPGAIAVAGENVYWTVSSAGPCPGSTCGGVMQAPLAGGAATQIATNLSAISLAVDATSVYVATGNGEIVAVPIGGGTPQLLSFQQTSDEAVAVDGTSVYWANSAGDVMKAALDGGGATPLVIGASDIVALAIDDTNVYFTVSEGLGAVAKVPIGGGTPTMLASNVAAPYAIAVDATSVYVSTYDGVLKITPK